MFTWFKSFKKPELTIGSSWTISHEESFSVKILDIQGDWVKYIYLNDDPFTICPINQSAQSMHKDKFLRTYSIRKLEK